MIKYGKTIINPLKEAIIIVFLFILGILILLFISSAIQIEFINFRFYSGRKRHLNKNYEIRLKWCLFCKIPMFNIDITKTKMEKLKIKEKIKEFDKKLLQNKNKFDKEALSIVKKANIEIESFNIYLELGTENASLTAFLVPAIATILNIWLGRKVKDYDNQKTEIKPLFLNQNMINIVFSGIFKFKIIHIINIIYMLIKKGRVKKYERTSNRRSYAYRYE